MGGVDDSVWGEQPSCGKVQSSSDKASVSMCSIFSLRRLRALRGSTTRLIHGEPRPCTLR
eukprot:NODE_4926_length_303_cov_64.586614_g4481_i0.p2 GENE.NODE_4926_length_303_cov_64.586614_g4481_i0~~NODE_4926_length_303_cov_64.586614_g4481_i0.p2  ORF type:complete len:60 (-),score=14.98 NODE_4926_length_303_cov_64.586614_g4481_i0:14-193(-)